MTPASANRLASTGRIWSRTTIARHVAHMIVSDHVANIPGFLTHAAVMGTIPTALSPNTGSELYGIRYYDTTRGSCRDREGLE